MVKNGKNVIEEHKYIGPSVKGKDVFIVDDMIASGETILDTVTTIKKHGAKRIFVGVTFGFFTNGTDAFEKAYKKGLFDAIFITNASYVKAEVTSAAWYRKVNMTKYISYYIYCVNEGISISKILDPHTKISSLIRRYRAGEMSAAPVTAEDAASKKDRKE